jgi:hypothetical protein
MRHLAFALSVAAVAVAAGACSSSPSSTSGSNVSFTTDVMPFFEKRCATSQGLSCHGDPMVTGATLNGATNQQRPFLGRFLGTPASEIPTVYSGIVGVSSHEAPPLDYVKPNDPAHSFLWLKISGGITSPSVISQCTGGASPACGLPMPSDNTTLSTSDLNMISSWIQGGAPQSN